MKNYLAVLHKDEGSEFGVSFPDFPGCVAAGKDLSEAHENAAEALAFHIEGMIEDGEDIPEPSDLDHVRVEDGGVLILVPYREGSKNVRVNIMVREDVLAKIDRAAAKLGKTRSAYMVQSAIEELR